MAGAQATTAQSLTLGVAILMLAATAFVTGANGALFDTQLGTTVNPIQGDNASSFAPFVVNPGGGSLFRSVGVQFSKELLQRASALGGTASEVTLVDKKTRFPMRTSEWGLPLPQDRNGWAHPFSHVRLAYHHLGHPSPFKKQRGIFDVPHWDAYFMLNGSRTAWQSNSTSANNLICQGAQPELYSSSLGAEAEECAPRGAFQVVNDFGFSRGQSLHDISASHYQGPAGQAFDMNVVWGHMDGTLAYIGVEVRNDFFDASAPMGRTECKNITESMPLKFLASLGITAMPTKVCIAPAVDTEISCIPPPPPIRRRLASAAPKCSTTRIYKSSQVQLSDWIDIDPQTHWSSCSGPPAENTKMPARALEHMLPACRPSCNNNRDCSSWQRPARDTPWWSLVA